MSTGDNYTAADVAAIGTIARASRSFTKAFDEFGWDYPYGWSEQLDVLINAIDDWRPLQEECDAQPDTAERPLEEQYDPETVADIRAGCIVP